MSHWAKPGVKCLCVDVWRFRPLVTRTQEQDMELFTPLIDVHNHKELEREFQ